MAGLFGDSDPYAPQGQSSAPATPAPGGLFGNPNTDRLALTLAGLRDAIDPLTSNPTGGGYADKLKQQQLQQRVYKGRTDAFNAAYDPATGKFDGKKFIASLAGGGVTPTEQDVKDYLTPQKPFDIGGAGYALNNDTGKYEAVIPKAPKVKEDYNIPGIGRFNGETNQPIVLEPGVTPTQAAAAQAAQPSQTPATAPGGVAPPKGQIYEQIAQAASANGAQPAETPYLQRLASVESSGNPVAKNGSSTGLYQFHPDTFAAAGGGNINDVGDQTKAALVTSRQYRQTLQGAGLPPTDANTYILHQQGPAGGMALLQASQSALDRTKSAISVLTPIYGGDAAKARQAVVNNGGRLDTTAGQFVDMWQKRWGGPQPAPSDAPPAVAPAAAPVAAPGGPMTFTKASGHPSTAAELTSVGLKPGTPAWTGLDGKPVPYPASDLGTPDDAAMTKDAIDFQASTYLKNGVLPGLGNGKIAAQNKTAIINRATQIAKELNLSPEDFIAGTIGVKAAGAALSKATAMRSQIEGNEATVAKNADFALSLAPKGGGQTNVPVLNRFLQHVRGQYAGDPDVSAFNNAIGTVADEYAKVMTATTGAGGTSSDSARAEAYKRLSSSATLPQLRSNIAAMKTEMANRVDSMRNVEEGLRAQIKGGGSSAPQAAPAAPPKVRAYNPKTGRIE